jgi:hypothetical protein
LRGESRPKTKNETAPPRNDYQELLAIVFFNRFLESLEKRVNSAEQLKDFRESERRDSVVVLRVLKEDGQRIVAPFWRFLFSHEPCFSIRRPNGSTFSRKPRERNVAITAYHHARLDGCNVLLGGLATRMQSDGERPRSTSAHIIL